MTNLALPGSSQPAGPRLSMATRRTIRRVGQDLQRKAVNLAVVEAFAQLNAQTVRRSTQQYIISNGTSVITTGLKPAITFNWWYQILSWKIYGNPSGSVTIDLLKETHTAYPPSLSMIGTGTQLTINATDNNSGVTTDWATNIVSPGDVIIPEVTAVTSMTWVSFHLELLPLQTQLQPR